MFFPGIDCNQLPEVVLSPPVYCTHWVEKVFVGDHGDAPKVRKGKKRPLSARSYRTFIREGIAKIFWDPFPYILCILSLNRATFSGLLHHTTGS